MSLAGIFDIGKSALLASQTQLNVAGNNITNANTPGYSRQEVILEIATPIAQAEGFVGRGVTVAGIKRQYNSLLQNQIYSAQQDFGKSSSLNQAMNEIEQLFNEVQDLGLAVPLKDFFNAWQEVAANPEGLTERNLLLQRAESLILTARRMEQGILDVRNHLEDGIDQLTDEVNALAARIARLNEQISQIEAGSTTVRANDLRDQRDEALKNLNNLIEASYWEDKSSGSLTVTIGMKTIVSGKEAGSLSAVYNQEGNYVLKLDGQDITSRISKGEMGGLLIARREIDGTYLHDLRKLVAAITNTVNLQHGQGFDLDGSTGSNFFQPLSLTVRNLSSAAGLTASITDFSQLTLDEYTLTFNGGNYEIYNSETGSLLTTGAYDPAGTTVDWQGIRFSLSGPVTDQDRFAVSPLSSAIQNFQISLTSARQIAASGSLAGLPGDNTNALALAGLSDQGISALGSAGLNDYYESLVGKVGSGSRAAADELKFSDNFLTQLSQQRDAISGVNLDDEAANLVRFQRAYQAAARLISTADEIMQVLLNM